MSETWFSVKMISIMNRLKHLPVSISTEAALALKLVIQAGQEIMPLYNQGVEASFKSPDQPVTKADILSNQIISQGLKETNHPILSEESDDDKGRLKSDKIWILDPIDGTSDFIDKSGEFSIMLALVANQTPIMGIVYQPTTDDLYFAQHSLGAFKISPDKVTKLSVSDSEELSNSKVEMSRNHFTKENLEFLNYLGIKDYNNRGSVGLKVAEIAAGNSEAYFTFTEDIKHWDTAPAYNIITEAGGKMTDMLGNDLVYNTAEVNHRNGILVSNGKVHDKIVKAYQEFKGV